MVRIYIVIYLKNVILIDLAVIDTIETNGIKFCIVDFPRINGPHLVLDYFKDTKSKGNIEIILSAPLFYEKGIHILKFDPKQDTMKIVIFLQIRLTI